MSEANRPDSEDFGNLLRYFENLPDHPPLELLERRLSALTDALAAMNGNLSKLQVQLWRSAVIDRLKRLHVSGAASLVDAALRSGHAEQERSQGQDATPVEFAPWPTAVKGAALLQELVSNLEAHVALPPHASTALALAIVLSHAYDAFDVLPLIALLSPAKRCGKSTLLMLASALTQRSLLASNLTPASVFRIVERFKPTLLLDEADTVFRCAAAAGCSITGGSFSPRRATTSTRDPDVLAVDAHRKGRVLAGELLDVAPDRGGRGLLGFVKLDAETTITLRPGTTVIFPLCDGLLDALPYTPTGAHVSITFGGPVEFPWPVRRQPTRRRGFGFEVEAPR